MQYTSQHTDILINGGGLTGIITALALKKAMPSLSITVVEPKPPMPSAQPSSDNFSFDSKSVALAKASSDWLSEFGLFSERATYTSAIKHVWVSDKGHFGKTRIGAKEFAAPALGYVTLVAPFGEALYKSAQKHGIHFITGVTAKSVSLGADANTLQLSDESHISAKLVVASDGQYSALRGMMHIEAHSRDYQQNAVIANVQLAKAHQGIAHERFTEHGPIALLPLPDKRYSLVWCHDKADTQDLMALDDDAFCHALQRHFGYRAGLFTGVSKRVSYPLSISQSSALFAHRTVLLGNAAHTLHPIAGQGLNLSIRDAMALVEVVKAAQHPIGSDGFCRAYGVLRTKDIQHTQMLTDELVHGFANPVRSIALARNTGLFTMNLIPELKAPLARRLMGYTN